MIMVTHNCNSALHNSEEVGCLRIAEIHSGTLCLRSDEYLIFFSNPVKIMPLPPLFFFHSCLKNLERLRKFSMLTLHDI